MDYQFLVFLAFNVIFLFFACLQHIQIRNLVRNSLNVRSWGLLPCCSGDPDEESVRERKEEPGQTQQKLQSSY